MSLLAFSGGVDSTLVLYELCQNSRKNHPVRVINLAHPQIISNEAQGQARKKIIEHLRGDGYFIETIDIAMTHEGASVTHRGIIQPVLWLLSVAPYLEINEDFYMGYISGDCFWQFHHHFERAFNAFQIMQGKTGKLILPLAGQRKSDVITALKSVSGTLFDLTFYCEHPLESQMKDKTINYSACGFCDSCLTHRKSLFEIDLIKQRDNLVDEPALRKSEGLKILEPTPIKRVRKVTK